MEGTIRLQLSSLSVCQFSIFLRNGSLAFSDFQNNGINLEYLKTDRALFSRKIPFAQIWAKRTLNSPKTGFKKWTFKKILSLVFLGDNLK